MARVPGTCTEPGIITYTCNCGASYTETIAPSPNMVNGVCTVCGEGFLASGRCGSNLTWDRAAADRILGHETICLFNDVKKTDYFYEPILWTVENGVTTGISATSFGVNNSCTEAQAVTFLYKNSVK